MVPATQSDHDGCPGEVIGARQIVENPPQAPRKDPA